ncbi:hypothetical protein U0070_023746, partial [Myodes glareolus]
ESKRPAGAALSNSNLRRDRQLPSLRSKAPGCARGSMQDFQNEWLEKGDSKHHPQKKPPFGGHYSPLDIGVNSSRYRGRPSQNYNTEGVYNSQIFYPCEHFISPIKGTWEGLWSTWVMAVLWLLLLAGLPTVLLGVFVWVAVQNFLTADIPSTLKHLAKLWLMNCVRQYLIALHCHSATPHCHSCGFTSAPVRPLDIPCDSAVTVLKASGFLQGPVIIIIRLSVALVPLVLQPLLLLALLLLSGNLLSLLYKSNQYCKLPSYHHPVLANDCLNPTIYFLKHLESFGVDPSRVVLCGESIGGWAVATVTHVLTRIPDLPQVQKQVLIQPILNLVNFQLPSYQQSKNVPFLTRDMLFMCMCEYLAIDLSWKDATLAGAVIPLDKWKKYQRWIKTKHVWSAEISPVLADDKVISRLAETFLVSCENDTLRDGVLLYKKRLEEQRVPVNWCHVKDGFHGCIMLLDKKYLSFPCSMKVVNAVIMVT